MAKQGSNSLLADSQEEKGDGAPKTCSCCKEILCPWNTDRSPEEVIVQQNPNKDKMSRTK